MRKMVLQYFLAIIGDYSDIASSWVVFSGDPITITLLISLFCLLSLTWLDYDIYGQKQTARQNQTISVPIVTDPALTVQLVARDFHFPTSIAFLARNDILFLEKNTGDVYRLVNGNITGPLMHVDVSFEDEQGLLGIAVLEPDGENKDNTFVFLYYTQCKDQGNKSSRDCGNYIYRYKFETENNRFTDPNLILSLPALPGPEHNGGVLEIDKDKNLYVTIGDLQPSEFSQNHSVFDTRAQNLINGTAPDGRAGILRVTQDGKPVEPAILGHKYPLNLYYAYGIRNSFGIGFDPLTGNLWDTENGPRSGDEINLVKPGFNSGWEKVQGIWKLNQKKQKDGLFNESSKDVLFVDFTSKGKYSNPEFVWETTVGPTSLIFLDSNKLGKKYKNDIFVGSAENRIFHFDLNENRKSVLIG